MITKDELARVRELVGERGEALSRAAGLLGMRPDVLARIAAGFKVRAGSEALLREGLRRLADGAGAEPIEQARAS